MTPRRLVACLRAIALTLALCAATAFADEAALVNGGFVEWKAGVPTGWTASIGASRGSDGPESRVEPLEGGGLALIGDATVRRWKYVSQSFDLKRGHTLRLAFRARAVGLRREPGQFQSAYVGIGVRDATGRSLGHTIREVHSPEWVNETLHCILADRVASAEVAVFLSKTGRLEVESVDLQWMTPAQSFDVLVESMDRDYSFFAAHDIDWKALTKRHAARARAATTPSAFAAAVRPMLAALKDPHVWIQQPGGRPMPAWSSTPRANFDVKQVIARLASFEQVVHNVISGRTKEGYGYLALGTLQTPEAQRRKVDAALRALFETPALILDLRPCNGGNEYWAQRIAGCFTDETVPYARSRIRSAPAHDAFRDGSIRNVQPRTDASYRKPVVCLIGPQCLSSGEGMALMMKALPRVRLMGQSTRGASGNPQPVHLPNGVQVWFSRWMSLMPDGTPIERRGVPPDVVVEHAGGGDPTLDAAIAELDRQLKKR